MSDTGVTRIKNDYILEELGNTSGEILCLAVNFAEGLATLDPKLWVFPLLCRVPTKTHSFRGGPSTLSHRLSYAILTCSSCISYYSYITTALWILRQVIHFKHITVLVHGTKLVQMHRGACRKPRRNATQGSICFPCSFPICPWADPVVFPAWILSTNLILLGATQGDFRACHYFLHISD